MKRKNSILIMMIIVLSITALSMSLMIFGEDKYKETINKGVYINNVDVGNMTKAQAIEYMNKKVNDQFKGLVIKVSHKSRVFYIDFATLKARYDIESAVDKAYNFNKDKNLIARILQNMGVKKVNHNEMIVFESDTTPVEDFVRRVSKKLDYNPVDAQLNYLDGKFSIIKEKDGMSVDQKLLMKKIKAAVRPDWDESLIEIPTIITKSKQSEELLSHVKSQIAEFTTNFSARDLNRTSNIRTAAKSVDGQVLMPGQIFSMNKALGELDAKNGYKEAHVIKDGELTTGMAGGICQVTTTVYNAVLMANLDIVSRRGHSLKVGYVDPGRDATVSGGYIDFKFRNNNKYPIFMHTIVKGGLLNVKVFGENEHPGQQIQIESKVLEVIEPPAPQQIADSSMVLGSRVVETKAAPGYRSVTYRKVFMNGVLVKTERLSRDRYKPTRAKIRVGTKI